MKTLEGLLTQGNKGKPSERNEMESVKGKSEWVGATHFAGRGKTGWKAERDENGNRDPRDWIVRRESHRKAGLLSAVRFSSSWPVRLPQLLWINRKGGGRIDGKLLCGEARLLTGPAGRTTGG